MCVWQWKNNNFKLNYFLKLIGIGLGKTTILGPLQIEKKNIGPLHIEKMNISSLSSIYLSLTFFY